MKKSMKILAVAMIAILSMCCMAGCGGGNAEDAGGDQAVVYKAGTEPTYAPFDTTDEDGNIIGFDMDLMDAIAKDQGFKVEYGSFEFDSLLPATESGDIDIIAATMNVTPDRAKKVDFTDKYFDAGKSILVKKDNTTIKSDKDFTKDMKIAAQIGTAEADYVQKLAKDGKIAKAVILNQTTECILQLQNGDIDAIVIDAPVAVYYEGKYAKEIKMLDSLIDPAPMAFAVQKGNTELLDKINAGLKNVTDNGTYDKLVAKWFNSDAQ